jgi:hypothetical protein
VLAYQPASDGWLPVADLATARVQLGAAVGPDGRIYAVGGLDGAGAVSAAVEAYGPVIALSAGAGAAGSHVQVTGDNFAPSAQVDVFFAGAPAALGTGSTDPSGVLTAPIDLTVPSLPPATYPVRVVDRRSLFPVLARFTIQ